MQRRRQGVTLTESILVIATILVLASLAFVAGSPSREQARQAACKGQLRQMYMAVMMYSSDVDAGEEILGLPSLSYVPRYGIRVLEPYLRSKDVRYCPDLPSLIKRKIGTSYVWYPAAPFGDEEVLPGEAQMYAEVTARIRAWGSRFPMYVCSTHDEVYYQPREAHIHPSLTQPFIVEVAVDGSIHAGRRPYRRGNSLNAY